ncbi:MAG: GNAT family N-acetyltransferase [Gemmatimonadota bacterium]|nr:MAG: GNAT family N-acetyltransferase [Gemmatimonadota bacterium]
MVPDIIDLPADRSDLLEQTAKLLYESFVDLTPAWPDMQAARGEVLASLECEKICRVTLDRNGHVIGWAGAMPHYDGNVWELHPLVVAKTHRKQGYGRALVEDIERIVTARGALTLWVGSDDEIDATSLSGVDLYDDIPGAIRNVKNLKGHPYEFYTRLGFHIVGVMPDANGRGKPDIFLAKRIG